MRYNKQNTKTIVSVERKDNGNIRIFASMNLKKKEKIKLLKEAIEYLEK